MENAIKVFKQIERTHDGLGGYCYINQLSLLGNKSVFNIASSGSGKKVIIGGIQRTKDIYPVHDMEFDSLTLTSLAKRISIIHNKSLLWRIFEFATLTEYHRKLLLTIGSKIITDRNYTHTLGTGEKAIPIEIKNCDLSIFIGIQPNIFSNTVSNNDFWKALSNDRFIKLLVLNPLRKRETIDMPKFDVPSNNNHDYIFPERPPIMAKIFFGQVSEGRLNSLCKDMLKAYMIYEGYEKYRIKYELEFRQLFSPLITLFNKMYFTSDLDRPKVIKSGSLQLLEEISRHIDGITQKKLADSFNIYDTRKQDVEKQYKQDNIRVHARPLIHFGLIQKINEYPVTYTLSKHLIDYFEFYKGLIS